MNMVIELCVVSVWYQPCMCENKAVPPPLSITASQKHCITLSTAFSSTPLGRKACWRTFSRTSDKQTEDNKKNYRRHEFWGLWKAAQMWVVLQNTRPTLAYTTQAGWVPIALAACLPASSYTLLRRPNFHTIHQIHRSPHLIVRLTVTFLSHSLTRLQGACDNVCSCSCSCIVFWPCVCVCCPSCTCVCEGWCCWVEEEVVRVLKWEVLKVNDRSNVIKNRGGGGGERSEKTKRRRGEDLE